MSEKKAGILLPIFSLPSKYSIGSLGKEAYKFVDFLKESNQNYWQVLPVNPTITEIRPISRRRRSQATIILSTPILLLKRDFSTKSL